MSLPLARQCANSHGRYYIHVLRSTQNTVFPRHRTGNALVLGRYSTAAPLNATVMTPTPPPAGQNRAVLSRDPIVLPSPSLHAFNVAARVLPSTIAEQFAILNACIRSNTMDRAERIMTELYRTRSEEMKVFADLHIYNTYLNGFIEGPVPMTKQCLTWFDSMKDHGLTPDVNTYAVIVKGFLKIGSYHTARTLLQEMRNDYEYSIQEMLQSDFLSESDVIMFRKLTHEVQWVNTTEVQKLLRDLEHGTNHILGKPTLEMSNHPELATAPLEMDPREELPAAKPTETMGVKFLQQQLAALNDATPGKKVDPYELQLELERQGYEVALHRLIHMRESSMERGDTLNAMNLSPLKKTMWEWHNKLIPLIKEEIARCEVLTGRQAERRSYGPFLKLLPPEKLSIIIILELLRLHNSSGIADGMKTARAVIDVGKAVEQEYNATQIKKASPRTQSRNQEVHALFSSGKLFNMAVRKAHMRMAREQDSVRDVVESSEGDTGFVSGSDEWTPVWPSTIRAKIGSVLTSLLIEAATIKVPSRNPETGEKIIESIPAFFHTYQYVRGKRVGIVKFSDPLINLLSREPLRDTLHPRFLPMIVHPRPWLSCNSGGYLSAKTSCMRVKDSPEQLVYLNKASEQDRLHAVLAGLDVLGSTRWRVNKDVFKIVLEAWNSGEPIADIPPSITEPTPLPEKPENYDTDPKAKYRWVTQVKEQQTMEKNNHSLRCDVNYKVETARSFLNLPMYFPHNMDFRGRAYPIPPTLNHLGNDLCRGLLHFEEAKPLGERGWRWLKIHMANLYGFDKHSFTERENFTMDNVDNIMDSIENPLTGKKWWLKAEEPWQCLAACYEVAAAIRSGAPEEFMSHLPVHQDGTCNGLQHYAALGGDLAGAKAVNLAPSDRPADVYTGVADMVNKQIDLAAAEGNEHAIILQGKISRKVVKQTVMTNVYGVTFIGARTQLENRLKERDDIPAEKVYGLASYLARRVFDSMGEMFHGAHLIQDWLTDSAKRIAKSVPVEALHEAGILPIEESSAGSITELGPSLSALAQQKRRRSKSKRSAAFSARNPSSNQMTSVIWTTPLGLPIVQPYRRSGKKQVSTLLQTVFIEDPDASRPVNAAKQSSAFPPNFIHSLDATHMLMSAVACHEQGMTFASVHDSYWTHACDVDSMNKVIRDQFIELHSQPIMENLYWEFRKRYKNYKVPMIHDFDEKSKEKKKAKSVLDELEETDKDEKSLDEPDAMQRALFGVEDEDDLDEEELEGDNDTKSVKEPKKTLRKYRHSWETLTFAPLPAKGEFDINEVKQSPYFFH